MLHNPHHLLGQRRTTMPAGGSPSSTTLRLTDFGGDSTGEKDSAPAFDACLKAAWERGLRRHPHNFTDGPDLGGVVIDLEGGQYGVSRPIVFPVQGGGNVVITDGTVRALPAFGPLNNKDRGNATTYNSTNGGAFLFRFDGPATPSVNASGPNWYCGDMGTGGYGSCQWYAITSQP